MDQPDLPWTQHLLGKPGILKELGGSIWRYNHPEHIRVAGGKLCPPNQSTPDTAFPSASDCQRCELNWLEGAALASLASLLGDKVGVGGFSISQKGSRVSTSTAARLRYSPCIRSQQEAEDRNPAQALLTVICTNPWRLWRFYSQPLKLPTDLLIPSIITASLCVSLLGKT